MVPSSTPVGIFADLPNWRSAAFKPEELGMGHVLPWAAQLPVVVDTDTVFGLEIAYRVSRTPGALPFYVLGTAPPPAILDASCGHLGEGCGEETPAPPGEILGQLVYLAHLWRWIGGAVIYGEGRLLAAALAFNRPVVVVPQPRTRPGHIWCRPATGDAFTCMSWGRGIRFLQESARWQ